MIGVGLYLLLPVCAQADTFNSLREVIRKTLADKSVQIIDTSVYDGELTDDGSAVVYQAATRERDYRVLIARGDTALRGDEASSAIEAYSGAIALRR